VKVLLSLPLGFARALAGRGVAAVVSVGVFTVLARSLGTVELGAFLSLWTLAQAASLLGRGGLDMALLRRMSRATNEDDRRALHRSGEKLASIRSSVIGFTLSLSCVLFFLLGMIGPETAATGFVLLLSLPAFAGLHLGAEARKARGFVVQAQLIQGCGISLGVALAWGGLILSNPAWSTPSAFAIAVLHCLAAFGIWAVVRARSSTGRPSSSVRERWSGETGPLLQVGLARFVYPWIPLWILAVLASGEDAGAYSAAARVALLLELPMAALSANLATSLAGAHSDEQAWELLRRGRRHLAWIALPILVGLAAMPEHPLAMLAIDHPAASWVLRCLLVGQAVNLCCGPVGTYLLMRQRGPELRMSVVAGLATVLGMGLTLIPMLGIVGAAVASASGLAIQNFLALHSATPSNG